MPAGIARSAAAQPAEPALRPLMARGDPAAGERPAPASAPKLQAPAEARPRGFLHYLCLFYTVGLFAHEFVEFYTGGRVAWNGPLSMIYLAVLVAYAGDKEAGRWAGPRTAAEQRKRKGEWFVAGWAVFAFAVVTLAGLYPRFAVPRELGTITVEVVAIFFGTAVSKRIRDARAIGGILGERSGEETDLPGRVLALLASGAELTSSEIARALAASDRSVRRALSRLVEEGKLAKLAAGPNDPRTRYRVAS